MFKRESATKINRNPLKVGDIVRNQGMMYRLYIVVDIDGDTAIIRKYGDHKAGELIPATRPRNLTGKLDHDKVLIPGGQGDWIYQHVDTNFLTTGLSP